MRKLKFLGLALVVVGALSAVAASPAFSAYRIVGQASGGSVVASQTIQHKFATDIGTVSCSTAKFEGHQSTETASTLTVHPTYGGCSIGVPVTVNTTSCNYIFDKPITEPSPVHATVSIECSAGTSINIHDSLGLGCSVSVGPQGPLSQVSFVNSAPSVTATAAVSGITYTDNGKCPNTTEGHTNSTGTYSGVVSASGFTSGGVANKIEVT